MLNVLLFLDRDMLSLLWASGCRGGISPPAGRCRHRPLRVKNFVCFHFLFCLPKRYRHTSAIPAKLCLRKESIDIIKINVTSFLTTNQNRIYKYTSPENSGLVVCKVICFCLRYLPEEVQEHTAYPDSNCRSYPATMGS